MKEEFDCEHIRCGGATVVRVIDEVASHGDQCSIRVCFLR